MNEQNKAISTLMTNEEIQAFISENLDADVVKIELTCAEESFDINIVAWKGVEMIDKMIATAELNDENESIMNRHALEYGQKFGLEVQGAEEPEPMEFDEMINEMRKLAKQARENGDEQTALELYELASEIEKNGLA